MIEENGKEYIFLNEGREREGKGEERINKK